MCACVHLVGICAVIILRDALVSPIVFGFFCLGEYYTHGSKAETGKCTACGPNLFQNASTHRETKCLAHVRCDAGEYQTGTSPSKRGTCVACPKDLIPRLDKLSAQEYQIATDHVSKTCDTQPVCTPLEFFVGGGAKDKGQCKASQYKCDEGQFVQILTSGGKCITCPNGQYRASKGHDFKICLTQVSCSVNQWLSGASLKSKGSCKVCQATVSKSLDYYQDETGHQQTTCKDQTKCGKGQKLVGTPTQKGTCAFCSLGLYQDETSHTQLQCKPLDSSLQCQEAQFFDGGPTVAKGACKACVVPKYYQDEKSHFVRTCKDQTTCKTLDTQYLADASNKTKGECKTRPSCTSIQFLAGATPTTSGTCTSCEAKHYADGTCDKTDTALKFSPSTNIILYEGRRKPQYVTHVQAYDPQTNQNKTKDFTPLPSNSPFVINTKTGHVYTKPYTCLGIGNKVIEVSVLRSLNNLGTKAVIAKIPVFVRDTQFQGLEFEQKQYDFTVKEDLGSNSFGSITAYDQNCSHSAAKIQYTWNSNTKDTDGNDMFKVESIEPQTPLTATTFTLVGKGTCADASGTKEPPFYKKSNAFSDITGCKNLCATLPYCVAYEFAVSGIVGTIRNCRVFGLGLQPELKALLGQSFVFQPGSGGSDAMTMVQPNLDFQCHAKQYTTATNTGNIFLRSTRLDYEDKQEHLLIIKAFDQSLPSLLEQRSATAVIKIQVTNVIDEAPIFDKVLYETSVSDDIKVDGTALITVHASDPDNDGISSKDVVAYSLKKTLTSIPFKVSNETGKITLDGPLCYAKATSYSFQIQGVDTVSKKALQDTFINIYVKEKNLHAPKFGIIPNNTYPEDQQFGVLFGIKATDADCLGNDAKITYELRSGDSLGQFSVDATSGAVSLVKSLDYEDRTKYTLVVRAHDGTLQANPRFTDAVISIAVSNVNDLRPQFVTQSYSIVVAEGAKGRTFDLKLQAKDADSKFYFGLENTTVAPLFKMEQDGTITTLQPFCESRDAGVKPFTLNMYVSDVTTLGVPSKANTLQWATLAVTIKDDGPPTFLSSGYKGVVFENSPKLTKVMTDTNVTQPAQLVVKAEDKNCKGERNVKYAVEGTRFFGVNETDGRIFLLESNLDREDQALHSFYVAAHDSGASKSFSRVAVQIVIKDMDDHVPIFPPSRRPPVGGYEVTIPETALADIVLLSVEATDADEKPGAIVYTATNCSSPGTLAVKSDGKVLLNRTVDYDKGDQKFTCTIQASNAKAPPGQLSWQSTAVMVVVTNANDNAPIFNEASYFATVSEGAKNDLNSQALLTIQATDAEKQVRREQKPHGM